MMHVHMENPQPRGPTFIDGRSARGK